MMGQAGTSDHGLTENWSQVEQALHDARAERDRCLITLDAIRLEAEACADVNEPVGTGWLIATCEEAMQGV